ncbi:MAG: hypothetical protein ABSA11_07465 [Candidatus Bathyarchaeia archaeon]
MADNETANKGKELVDQLGIEYKPITTSEILNDEKNTTIGDGDYDSIKPIISKFSIKEITQSYINNKIPKLDFLGLLKYKEYSIYDINKILKDTQPLRDIMINKGGQPTEPAAEKEQIQIRNVRCISTDHFIAETIRLDGTNIFLIYQPNTDRQFKWTTSPFVLKDSITYLPEIDEPYKPYTFTKTEIDKLISSEIEIPTLYELYDQILNIIRDYIVVPDEYLSLIANTILVSYEQEKFDALGYLAILGIPGCGKTRIGEIIYYIGYRPLMDIGLNSANVYDYIGTETEGNCIIIADEIQTNENDPDLLKIYRSGYRKGFKIRRITDPSSATRSHRYYNIYSLKVFIGYYMPPKDALSERCITINVINGDPVKDIIKDSDRQTFQELKKRILLSRMAHYFDPLPIVKTDIKGRDKEIWLPQLVVAETTNAKENINKLLKEYLTDMENRNKAGIDRKIVACVLRQTEFYETHTLKVNSIWNSILLTLCKDPKILQYYPNIDSFQYELGDTKVSKWLIGKKLKPVLCGKDDTKYFSDTSTTERVWTFDKKILDQLEKSLKITDTEKDEFVIADLNQPDPPTPPKPTSPSPPQISLPNTLEKLFNPNSQ